MPPRHQCGPPPQQIQISIILSLFALMSNQASMNNECLLVKSPVHQVAAVYDELSVVGLDRSVSKLFVVAVRVTQPDYSLQRWRSQY